MNKSISETIQERDRVKVTDIMNLGPGEFYGLIAEGNEHELLKSKFETDEKGREEVIDFPLIASEMEIKINYYRIIAEANGILEPVNNQGDSLLKF
ncbi:hypothetical protein [Maribacter aurantiacus]|uniref:Uncharacterized protein n=1 Tax=Maribacter aurantiacus TaxID=1882343 RepID=A0A5R8M0V7_9FLAO|nr:hypothetical protein [Maribacter aurantiacus]TLF43190.1 hypothetical protein FEK29_13835 [Maribacter aurantiacus]